MTKRNPEFGGFSACFAVRTETDRKGKATPPARTETDWAQTYTAALHGFQPTPPARTETGRRILPDVRCDDFNPLRPRGRRQVTGFLLVPALTFQPTPPARTETYRFTRIQTSGKFQPTPPARTETTPHSRFSGLCAISTHSAREDGDHGPPLPAVQVLLFQPTPPARTETI